MTLTPGGLYGYRPAVFVVGIELAVTEALQPGFRLFPSSYPETAAWSLARHP